MKKLLIILILLQQKKVIDAINYNGIDYVFYNDKSWITNPSKIPSFILVDSIPLPNGKKYLMKKDHTYILKIIKK